MPHRLREATSTGNGPVTPDSMKKKPAVQTPRGKRKCTIDDEFVSLAVKKRATKFRMGACLLKAPASSIHTDLETNYPLTNGPESSAHSVDLKFLQSLYSSLLTVLLLHRTHHRSTIHPPVFDAVKVDAGRLCRRKITLGDVRKIIYLSHYSNDIKELDEHREMEGGLMLTDYGDNKICIDFTEKTRKLINFDSLMKDFASRVRAFWETTNSPAPPSAAVLPTAPSLFIIPSVSEKEINEKPGVKRETIVILMSTIPLAKIHVHPKAVTIVKAHRIKGQQRLDDLMRRHQPAVSPIAKSGSKAPPAMRCSSLLDRIRAKAAIAVEAAGQIQSKEETELIAAEQRIPDIEPILKGLAGRGSSMTMKAVVEGIRESFRNPVSSKEAERVVKLIAKREGDNGWVKIREVGKIVGVVFGKRAENGKFL